MGQRRAVRGDQTRELCDLGLNAVPLTFPVEAAWKAVGDGVRRLLRCSSSSTSCTEKVGILIGQSPRFKAMDSPGQQSQKMHGAYPASAA